MYAMLMDALLHAVGLAERPDRKLGLRLRRPGTAAAPSAAPLPPAHAAGGHKRLLLLESDEESRLRTRRYFLSVGWTVDAAQSAVEGESLLRHQRYDLAILHAGDAAAEGAGALALLRWIRGCDRRTPVVVLGADLSAQMEADARDLGAAAVLRSPLYLPDLGHLAFSLTGEHRG